MATVQLIDCLSKQKQMELALMVEKELETLMNNEKQGFKGISFPEMEEENLKIVYTVALMFGMSCFTCEVLCNNQKTLELYYVAVFRTASSRKPLLRIFDFFEGNSSYQMVSEELEEPIKEDFVDMFDMSLEITEERSRGSLKNLLTLFEPKKHEIIEKFHNLPPENPLNLHYQYDRFRAGYKEVGSGRRGNTNLLYFSEDTMKQFSEYEENQYAYANGNDGQKYIVLRTREEAEKIQFGNESPRKESVGVHIDDFKDNMLQIGTDHILVGKNVTKKQLIQHLGVVDQKLLNIGKRPNHYQMREEGDEIALIFDKCENASLILRMNNLYGKIDPSTPTKAPRIQTGVSGRSRNSKVAKRFIEGHLDDDEDKNKYVIYARNDDQQLCAYSTERVIGKGSFGTVYKAVDLRTREVVAIKKVFQNPRFKNRELPIMKELHHANIVSLLNYFHTRVDERPQEDYLNLVMEYIPETVFRMTQNYLSLKRTIPMLEIKLIMYQLCRSLAYLHAKGICHRDIKPQNLLIDPYTGVSALCDFGSAKRLVPTEPNVSYICSRFYRAPELIFGATYYTTAVDIWSAGCVMGELLVGSPLFPGESGIDQLVEIIKKLGTPAKEEMNAMNKDLQGLRFPRVNPRPWRKIFRKRTPPEAIDLVSKLLRYDPVKRILAIESLAHPFFDELRDPDTKYMNNSLPPLFNFTEEECDAMSPDIKRIVFPSHMTHLYDELPHLEHHFKNFVPRTTSPVPMTMN